MSRHIRDSFNKRKKDVHPRKNTTDPVHQWLADQKRIHYTANKQLGRVVDNPFRDECNPSLLT